MAVKAFHEFASPTILAQRLAERVQINCREAQKPALLALSGGSTPALFLQELSGIDEACVLMVDDRWVPSSSDRSNERFLKQKLGFDQCGANILPLYDEQKTVEEAAHAAGEVFRSLGSGELTVCILGMGTDGHTASWFPGGDNLAAATDTETDAIYLPMNAPNVPEPRITMTLPPIARAKNLVLHIEGAEKRAVFEEAMKDGDADALPIRHILRHPKAQIEVYWTT